MDPSPFRDRDLDSKAEEFILSWAHELPPRKPIELVIHVDNPPPAQAAAVAQDAVRHYFASRTEMKQREFRMLLRRGRMSLFIGLVFLAGCLVTSEIVTTTAHSTLAKIVGESLTIVGWVALWRPLEIYLYDWWPMLEERRILKRLEQMVVRIETKDGGVSP